MHKSIKCVYEKQMIEYIFEKNTIQSFVDDQFQHIFETNIIKIVCFIQTSIRFRKNTIEFVCNIQIHIFVLISAITKTFFLKRFRKKHDQIVLFCFVLQHCQQNHQI